MVVLPEDVVDGGVLTAEGDDVEPDDVDDESVAADFDVVAVPEPDEVVVPVEDVPVVVGDVVSDDPELLASVLVDGGLN